MKCVLGIDTSNYTTSAAFFDASENCFQQKMLLPVKKGEVGLRQSDAVFHHTQQLPQVIKKLFSLFEGLTPEGIGVSVRPRDQEDSYMPVSYTHLDVYKRQILQRTAQTGETLSSRLGKGFDLSRL